MKFHLQHYGRRLRRAVRTPVRWTYYGSAVALAILALLYTVARVLLPQVEERKGEIEQLLSAKTAHTVRIDRLTAFWDGLLPGVHIEGLSVTAKSAQKPALRLAEAQATFALLPLLWGNVEIRGLVLTKPSVTLERLADGRLRVSGFEAAAVDAPGADEKFIRWLLRQRHLALRDGEIVWIDRLGDTELVHLTQVQFELRNRGERHKAGLSARFPQALCRDCAVAIDLRGNPFVKNGWDGEIYVRAVGFDVEAFPRIVRERLPATLRGRFDAELWSDWDDGAPSAVHGTIDATALQVPLRGLARPVRLGAAKGGVDWRRRGDGWHLDVRPLALTLHGKPWSAERLRLERDDATHRLRVRRIELAELSRFVADLQGEHPLLTHWTELNPAGVIEHLDIELDGELGAPNDYRLRGELARLSLAPSTRTPGVKGLSGRLAMSKTEGEFKLNARDFEVELPQVFRAPLPGRQLQGLVAWTRDEAGWRVYSNDVRLLGDGAVAAEFNLIVPHDSSISPRLTLRADVENANGQHASRYYPAAHLPPKILAWMDSSFLGGTVTRARVVFDGAVRRFPFDDGSGRFEVRAHVRDGIYRYLKGWTPVTHADVDVTVTGRDVLVTGSGRIGTLAASEVVVATRADTSSTDPTKRRIAVTGKIAGPVAETLRILTAVEADAEPRPFWQPYVPALQAQGDGVLRLDVNVPLGVPGATFSAEYRLAGATLRMAAPDAALTDISGHVRFSDRGVDAGALRAQLLGGEVALSAARNAAGVLTVAAQGQMRGRDVGRLYGAAIGERISGVVPWKLAWRDLAGLGDLQFEAALEQLRWRLPAPFADSDRPAIDRLRIATEPARGRVQLVTVDGGDTVRGKLVAEKVRDGWQLARGHVGFNMPRVALPTRPGLQVSARVDRLDLDAWQPLLPHASDAAPPTLMRRISAEIKQLDAFDRAWGRLYLDLTPERDGWRAALDGDSAVGRALYVPATARKPMSAKLDLSVLRLPATKKHAAADTPLDPHRLPAIELHTAMFEHKGRNIGAVDFRAAPHEQGWRIARFDVTRPEGRFSSRGTWRAVDGRHTSAFDIELSTSDLGQTLAGLGAEGQVKGGKVDLRANLVWSGSPTDPRLSRLDGRVEVAAEKGRFLQVDAGAARLFGLLDLRAITRYLTLDFSSIFGKGLVYDQIHGTVTIERGNAYTRDLFVKGPSVALTVEGRIGLAAEDFDLVLAINPKFSDTLTLTSWGLFGPQAAAAILAIQKIFKKQIAAGTRVTYLVKGPWDDPTVSKLGKPAPESTAGADE